MSEVKVNKISPRTNCGTVTLGDSGDTFTIPSGATIQNLGTSTGFGGTGVVSWNTTKITADPSPAVTGTGYFCDTSGGSFTVTLPASPSAGDVVGVSDYAKTFDTGNLTLGRNSEKIGGSAADATISTEGIAITLVYVDSTKGWIVTDSGNQSEAPDPSFVTATVSGACNTLITSGDFKTAIFKGPGTFCVSCAGNSAGSNTADYVIVASGGGGGSAGGGGGAGGFRLSNSVGCLPAPTMSPLVNPTGFSVAATPYPVVVGGAGTAGGAPNQGGGRGNVSSVFCVSSAGGGGSGGHGNQPPYPTILLPGGSGGGGGNENGAPGWGCGGTGNTPPVSPSQGNDGGDGGPPSDMGGSGGGAGAAGTPGTSGTGSAGGAGSFINDAFFGPTAPSYGTPGPTGSTRYFAGGGGSIYNAPTPGAGGAGGGGPGKEPTGSNGTTNTGGGGGASAWTLGTSAGGAGGSGIVMIRYKFQ